MSRCASTSPHPATKSVPRPTPRGGRYERCHEHCLLWVSAVRPPFLAEAGWPRIQQVLRVERTATAHGV